MAFFDELKRRKVFRVTSLYAVTAWGASLGAAELFPTFGLPDESVRWFVISALGLLPVVALLAWLYELTPRGIERDPADIRAGLADSDDEVTSASTRGAPQRSSPELIVSWNDSSKNFKRSFTIGRDESCELHIDDPKISRRHVRVVAQHGTWYIEDLGSSNGTCLNGEMVTRAVMPATASVSLYDGGADIKFQLAAGSGATTILAGAPDDS